MSDCGFCIGKYRITGALLAPMAGYTDIAFRELCREYGAGLTVTEMVSVRGLKHDSKKTGLLMRLSPKESPSCIQLFGNDPDDFARAAGEIESDIIDINMGCPMPKIVKNGDGSALLNDPERAGEIVRALVNATDKPITVKTRLGYEIGVDQAAELIESVTEAGAAAVAVHGRYAEQRYSGECDFDKLKALAKNTRIPFIVNGNCTKAETPPFAATMIGRTALANPAVFRGERVNPKAVATKHLELLLKYFDERYAVIQMRKFVSHYFASVVGGKEVRVGVHTATTVDEVKRALDRAQN
ncbi:MAG: tRNA dihydrouridine synthase DusB [Clostridiales bacterium]|nr:tRNA dihydrouridine synthase DusB [Clostridiales bacterium]